MRVLINKCYGGYGLSKEAVEKLRERKVQGAMDEVLPGEPWDVIDPGNVRENIFDSYDSYSCDGIPRNDPDLLAVFDELGEAMNGTYANLVAVEIPGDVEWHIEEYDGQEWIAEDHRTWH